MTTEERSASGGSTQGRAGGQPLGDLFPRTEADAILTDDELGDSGVVTGFVCESVDGWNPRRSDDRALISSNGGTEHALGLDEAEEMRTATAGERPILRLHPEKVDSPTPEAFKLQLLSRISSIRVELLKEGRQVTASVKDAVEQAATNGYDVWAVGGLVRDALLPSETAPVSFKGDFDVLGSIPPGTFRERLRKFIGRAEIPVRLNPSSGVVAVYRDPRRSDRVLEYAPLKSSIHKSRNTLIFGSDLEADAGWRDLTINTLSYDWRSDCLIDPTGRGVKDLDPVTLHPPGELKDWPKARASIFFRYLKFMVRWPDACTVELKRTVQHEFERFRQDIEMLPENELSRLLEPFGSTAGERVKRVVALAEGLAPERDWSGLFAERTVAE